MFLQPQAEGGAVEVQGLRPWPWVPDWAEGMGPLTEGVLSASLPSALLQAGQPRPEGLLHSAGVPAPL